MDGPRFDALAKAWSTTRPRRSLLKGLAGSIGAGLLAARGVKRAAAACTQYGRACGRHGDCCSENCVDGTCACRTGKTRCGKRCVDLRNNETHCGACDTPCPEDQQCRDGQCGCSQYGAACKGDETCCSKNCVDGKCACPKGRTRCGKRCVNTATDEANCGKCGNACGDTSECVKGTCTRGAACEQDGECASGICCWGECAPAGSRRCDGNFEVCCGPGRECCETHCCPEGTHCCWGDDPFCVGPDRQCCGNGSCPIDKECCIYAGVNENLMDCCGKGEVCTEACGCIPEGTTC
jgi:hypothetical protein